MRIKSIDLNPESKFLRKRDKRLLRHLPWHTRAREAYLVELGKAQIPENIDIKKLRKREGLSQKDFSRIYGIPIANIKSWEAGSNVPSTTARAYLCVIEKFPQYARMSLGIKY